jgi:hypothetical protein
MVPLRLWNAQWAVDIFAPGEHASLALAERTKRKGFSGFPVLGFLSVEEENQEGSQKGEKGKSDDNENQPIAHNRKAPIERCVALESLSVITR